MVHAVDPVGSGFVRSLPRPGGNITGLTLDAGFEIVAKRLELLKELAPKLSRVALLHNPSAPQAAQSLESVEDAGRKHGVTVQPVEVRRPDDVEAAFATMIRDEVRGFMAGDPIRFLVEVRSPTWPPGTGCPASTRAGNTSTQAASCPTG